MAELQAEVEVKRAAAEQERLRAVQLAKSKVEAEQTVTGADATLYKSKREAEATMYAQEKAAEAQLFKTHRDAEAALYSQQKAAESLLAKIRADAAGVVALADANLYKATKESEAQMKAAEGLQAMYEAKAMGLKALSEAFGGNSSAVIQYLMIEKGIYQDLAKSNAEAIRGLQPKMNIWNTTGAPGDMDGTDGSGDPMRPLRSMQSLIPLISNINEMTGIKPPNWVAQVPDIASAAERVPVSVTSSGRK
ncbi:hypothetical protein HDU76_000947 [Blyttiomyces sp. JEL0837]|nr:hypothetical protein HDU76_000947 [Blyttiomyces sp. JEL0837]